MNQVLLDKMKLLNIKCSKCLDTQVLWKKIKSKIGLIYCNKCKNGKFIKYLESNKMKKNNIPIFYDENNRLECRIKILDQVLNKNINIEISEDLVEDNIIEYDNDEDDKKSEIRDTRSTSKNNNYVDIPLYQESTWLYFKEEYFDQEVATNNLKFEIGKVAENIMNSVEMSGGNILDMGLFIKNIIINVSETLQEIETNYKEIKKLQDLHGTPIYIFIDISNKFVYSNCFDYLCCQNLIHLNIKYKIMKPKNYEALKICNEYFNINNKSNIK